MVLSQKVSKDVAEFDITNAKGASKAGVSVKTMSFVMYTVSTGVKYTSKFNYL